MGQEGEQHPTAGQTELLEKHNKTALNYSLDVPGGCRDAWMCMAKPRAVPGAANSKKQTLGVKGTLLGSSWKGKLSVLLHS